MDRLGVEAVRRCCNDLGRGGGGGGGRGRDIGRGRGWPARIDGREHRWWFLIFSDEGSQGVGVVEGRRWGRFLEE